MSIGICGGVYCQRMDLEQEVALSYCIMECAVKHKIGCKLGGNISQNAYKILESEVSDATVFIELMDTPLDNYANTLCQPSLIDDECVEEKFVSNLQILQAFLEEVAADNRVKGIVLYFNYEFWESDDERIAIDVRRFQEIMLERYRQNDFMAPVLVVFIKKIGKLYN